MKAVGKKIDELQKVLPSQLVRLSYYEQGRSDRTEGRVEVYHEGEWGTVCDDSLISGSTIYDKGNKAAQVICKQLGYSSGVPIVTSEGDKGTGPIWMDEVVCSGEETSLLDCQADWSYVSNDCHHYEDFSVSCSN